MLSEVCGWKVIAFYLFVCFLFWKKFIKAGDSETKGGLRVEVATRESLGGGVLLLSRNIIGKKWVTLGCVTSLRSTSHSERSEPRWGCCQLSEKSRIEEGTRDSPGRALHWLSRNVVGKEWATAVLLLDHWKVRERGALEASSGGKPGTSCHCPLLPGYKSHGDP